MVFMIGKHVRDAIERIMGKLSTEELTADFDENDIESVEGWLGETEPRELPVRE